MTLAPLSLTLLPGLSPPLCRDLHALRVLTLGDLAALPPALLIRVFGLPARQWQRLARGARPWLCVVCVRSMAVAPNLRVPSGSRRN
jgi:hypothetical protein